VWRAPQLQGSRNSQIVDEGPPKYDEPQSVWIEDVDPKDALREMLNGSIAVDPPAVSDAQETCASAPE